MNTKTQYYPNCDASVWLRTCKEEIIRPMPGKISGTIPKWLNGVLIRNGPGLLEVGEDTCQHLFDSLALLHRFAISGGNATYQCRFLQSDVYKRNKKANRIVVTEFGTKSVPDPCKTIFQRIAATFMPLDNLSDNAMISVYPFGDELYTFTEHFFIYRVNQETLETEQKRNLSKNTAIVTHTAHPHIVKDGTVYNLAMSVKKTGLHHNIVCFPATSRYDGTKKYSMFDRAHIVATIPSRSQLNPSYMHTFGITKNYFVIVEQPLSLSVPKLIAKHIKHEPLGTALQWRGEEMTKFNIVSKKTGKLSHKFYSKAFCYFHIINQYEISNHIVLDVCSYKDASMINCMYVESLMNMQNNPDYANMLRSQPIRFVLPLSVSKKKTHKNQNLITIVNTKTEACFLPNGNIFVKPEQLCNISCETPTRNYRSYSGKEYRYFYAVRSDIDAETQAGLIKVDTCSKTAVTWYEKNCYPSEPIFVSKPHSKDEDDGIILAAMVWGYDDTNRVGLIILDAKTFTEIGRAEFQTPSPVPKCLHGWYLSNNTD